MDIEKLRKYKNEFEKENYKQFKTKLKPNEMEEVNRFLKKNNMNKREFVLKGCELIKIDNLKKEAKEIILKYRINNEFIEKPNLGEGKKEVLKNGIVIYSYTFPTLNNEKMLVLRIEFKDEILYYGVVNYNRSPQILEEIEKLDTFF